MLDLSKITTEKYSQPQIKIIGYTPPTDSDTPTTASAVFGTAEAADKGGVRSICLVPNKKRRHIITTRILIQKPQNIQKHIDLYKRTLPNFKTPQSIRRQRQE